MAHERRRVSSCSYNWSTHTYPTSQGPSFVLVNYLARLGLLLAQGRARQGVANEAAKMHTPRTSRASTFEDLQRESSHFIYTYVCVCVGELVTGWSTSWVHFCCSPRESQYIDRITFITKRGKPQLKPQIAYIRLQLHTGLYRCVHVCVYVCVCRCLL